MSCLFCNIAKGAIPTTFVYEDESVVAFNDIHPQAPLHQIIIPKKHIATLNDLSSEDEKLMGHLVIVAAKLANDLKIADKGYRLVTNCNADGGQTVFHIHIHLIGGRSLQWPPG